MHASLTVTALPSWPMGGHDMRRSGQSEYIGTQSEYLAWNYNGGGTNLGTDIHVYIYILFSYQQLHVIYVIIQLMITCFLFLISFVK